MALDDAIVFLENAARQALGVGDNANPSERKLYVTLRAALDEIRSRLSELERSVGTRA